MRMKVLSAVVLALFMQCGNIYAQGCSDAGVCTAPTIRLADTASLMHGANNTFTAGAVFGTAQYKVSTVVINAEYVRQFGKLTLSGKVAYSFINGPVASNSGLADGLFTIAYSIKDRITPMLGLKIPFNNANKMYNGLTLPMAYQTSLGTTDILAGLSYSYHKWGFALAWQQPVVQNSSSFFITDYPVGSIDNRYRSTNGFVRRADILARASYSVYFGSKWLFTPGILPIYHVGDDTWVDKTGQTNKILNSRGLTLNTNVALRYSLGTKSYVRLTVGAPVLARKVRPEGLTKFGVVLEYVARF